MDLTKLKARYGAVTTITAACVILLLALDRFSVVDVAGLTVNDPSTKSSIASALITVSGIILSVMLAIIAVVTAMSDDRPVVILMKRDLKNYDELIHYLLGPIVTGLLLAAFALVCLLAPSATPAQLASGIAIDRSIFIRLIPAITLGLTVGLFVQTFLVARLLGIVLLFKKRGTDDLNPNASPEKSPDYENDDFRRRGRNQTVKAVTAT